MLKRLYIHNYKCLVDFELELGPLSVFVGENGSGKSAVPNALLNLRAVASGDYSFPKAFGPEKRTRWIKGDMRQIFELEALLGGESYTYRVEINAPDNGETVLHLERLSRGDELLFENFGGDLRVSSPQSANPIEFPVDTKKLALDLLQEDREAHAAIKPFKSWFLGSHFSDLQPDQIGEMTSDSTGPFSRLTLYQNGLNFATWYSQVSSSAGKDLSVFLVSVIAAVKGLSDLRMESVSMDFNRRALVAEFLGDTDRAHTLRFGELSPGQKSLIIHQALLFFKMKKGNLIAFDEPDNFVALREIQPWLLDVEERCANGDAQCVIISHNPEVIDCLGREYGIYFYRDEKGATRTKPLNEVIPPDSDLSLSGHISNGWVNMEAK